MVGASPTRQLRRCRRRRCWRTQAWTRRRSTSGWNGWNSTSETPHANGWARSAKCCGAADQHHRQIEQLGVAADRGAQALQLVVVVAGGDQSDVEIVAAQALDRAHRRFRRRPRWRPRPARSGPGSDRRRPGRSAGCRCGRSRARPGLSGARATPKVASRASRRRRSISIAARRASARVRACSSASAIGSTNTSSAPSARAWATIAAGSSAVAMTIGR